jgi:hypothetical protein
VHSLDIHWIELEHKIYDKTTSSMEKIKKKNEQIKFIFHKNRDDMQNQIVD